MEEEYSVLCSKGSATWLNNLMSLYSNLITCTNLIHFTFTFTLLKLKPSTCFGQQLPLLRRHYATTVLVGVACCYIWLDHTPWTDYINNSTLRPRKLCSCSASWGWTSDARNMSRLWVSIKWKWMWSVSSWCLLLNYSAMHCQQNITAVCRIISK
jgi:hypothetical protein